jgi:hypothetical protein
MGAISILQWLARRAFVRLQVARAMRRHRPLICSTTNTGLITAPLSEEPVAGYRLVAEQLWTSIPRLDISVVAPAALVSASGPVAIGGPLHLRGCKGDDYFGRHVVRGLTGDPLAGPDAADVRRFLEDRHDLPAEELRGTEYLLLPGRTVEVYGEIERGGAGANPFREAPREVRVSGGLVVVVLR